MKVFLILFTICFSVFTSGFSKDKSLEVKSPDGSIRVHVRLKEGAPVYWIQRNKQPVLTDSKLGFILKDQPGLVKDFKVG